MKSIRDLQELVWLQPHATQRVFELRAGEEVLGSLRWESSFGSLADARAEEVHWTFKRTGFFSPQITIRLSGSDANLAVFTPNWKGEGVLDFSGGKCFRWLGIGFWRSQWAFARSSGEHLLELEPKTAFFKRTAVVKVTPDGRQTSELPLLVILGWYLMVLRSDDDASVAASTAVICSAT